MRLVVDASVVAKWFNIEELSEKAVELKDVCVKGGLTLAAPTHLIYEVGNSIWKNPQLTDKDAANAITALLHMDLELLPPSGERASRTIEIARSRRVSFYDASYLQVAEELETTLLTADEEQAEAGRGIVETLHLRESKL